MPCKMDELLTFLIDSNRSRLDLSQKKSVGDFFFSPIGSTFPRPQIRIPCWCLFLFFSPMYETSVKTSARSMKKSVTTVCSLPIPSGVPVYFVRRQILHESLDVRINLYQVSNLEIVSRTICWSYTSVFSVFFLTCVELDSRSIFNAMSSTRSREGYRYLLENVLD